jgi:transposase-like protein
MMLERGVPVRHSTIHRWVRRYGDESVVLGKASPNPLRRKYHVEEANIYVKGQRKYLYRAISPEGDILDFKFCDVPESESARELFRSHLQAGEVTGTVVNYAGSWS